MTSTHVAPSSGEEPSAPTEQSPASSPTNDDVPLSTSRSRAARPRRGAACRRIAPPTQGTSNPSRRPPSSDTIHSATVSHFRPTTSGVPYAEIPQHLHQQPEIQTYYTLPPGINANAISRSFVPRSMGTFESDDYAPYPSLLDPPPVAGHPSDESSVSSDSAPPSEILSASDCSHQLLYPDTTAFMLNPSSSTQYQGSTSSSSLSADSSPYESHRHRPSNDYDSRTRVNSQSSFAHPVTQAANPSAGIHQGAITGNNQAFYFAEHHYLSSHSSSASTRSSPLETFFSPTSYVSSGSVAHRLEDEGLQVQTYAGDMELRHFTAAHNSFPPYTLPDGTGADETFNPYHYDTTHRK